MESLETNCRIYNSDLLKGTGLIQETMVLIDIYKENMSKQELIEHVLEFNSLAKEHENRTKDIVNLVFTKRYLKDNDSAVFDIQHLRNKYVSLEIISQILFIYTCRANLILFDFVSEIIQPLIKNGHTVLPDKSAYNFIEMAIRDGRIPNKWSDSTKQKVSEHMNACLIDFKIIDRSKRLLPFFLNDITANYWLHKQHFKGFSDEAVLSLEEWELFGLNKEEVVNLFHRLSLNGSFLFQHAGDITIINWKYKSMTELINGITE